MEKMLVRGVTKDTDVARISIVGVEDTPGVAFKIFDKLAAKNINIDIILQSVGRDGTKDITFTTTLNHVDTVVDLFENSSISYLQNAKVLTDTNVAKISVVGAGMETHPGTAAKMFEALFEADINIQMIATSEIKISVLIDKKDADRAVSAVHKAFIPNE
ncbi:Aspartate kinase [bioreactor metagenome]|uniref:aspartate kinase n=1 Tax=bioreactor metagenome TaxID=1076179 RepID=A0A645F036_9ZZZZ